MQFIAKPLSLIFLKICSASLNAHPLSNRLSVPITSSKTRQKLTSPHAEMAGTWSSADPRPKFSLSRLSSVSSSSSASFIFTSATMTSGWPNSGINMRAKQNRLDWTPVRFGQLRASLHLRHGEAMTHTFRWRHYENHHLFLYSSG